MNHGLASVILYVANCNITCIQTIMFFTHIKGCDERKEEACSRRFNAIP